MQKTKKKVIGQSWENSVTEGRAVLTSEEPLTAWKYGPENSVFGHFSRSFWESRFQQEHLCVLVWQVDGENVRILEPVKHLTKNTQYGYNWTILANTSKHVRAIENLKAIHIALLKLSLNDQLKSRNCSFLEMG